NSTPVVPAGSGTSAGNVNATITGLTAGTTCHFRLVGVAGTNTVNGGDMQFTTSCTSFTLPFSEGFSGTSIPTCWSQVDHQGNGQVWAFGMITGQTPLPALNGNYAFLNSGAYGSGASQNADLVSPVLDLSAYATVNLSFNHYFKSYAGSSGTLSSSTDNGATWSQIIQFTATSATNPAVYNASVAGVAGHSQVRFRWNYTGTWGYSWSVDDVLITGTSGGGPTLAVTPPNQNVTAPAGSTSFSVASNSAWTVVSDQSWCLVPAQGTGNGTLNVNYGENISVSQRVANITVTVAGLTPVVVTVTQDGALPALGVAPPNQNVPAAAGIATYWVTSNTGWSAASNQPWCTITPAGSGNGIIQANYSAHTGPGLRFAVITVTVAGLNPANVTLTQDGTTGTGGLAKDGLIIVPNPSNGDFEIIMNDLSAGVLQVTIFDGSGKEVLTRKADGKNTLRFSHGDFAIGEYYARIETESGSFSRTIVIR
ncbi:MAG: BACON domain-containing carbohydrate-binding protein, partial [Bacteroidota bacterium]